MALKEVTKYQTINGIYKFVGTTKGGDTGVAIRVSPSASANEVISGKRFPNKKQSSDSVNVEVSEVSGSWIHHLGYNGTGIWDLPSGWSIISSGQWVYFEKVSDPYESPYIDYEGKAEQNYYYPDAGTSSYKLQGTDTRETPGFYLRSTPGDNTITNTKTDIVLTIDYNNGSTNGSQTGQTWTETTYNFKGWDRTTTEPDSITSGTADHNAEEYRNSLNDESFYAVYIEGITSDPKYSNNTVTLTPPTKNKDEKKYKVTFDANGGTVSTETTSVTKKTTYEFSGWSGSTGVTISETTCTFKQTGTVTANYTPTTTEAKISSMPTPTRVGYKFLGWGTSTSQSSGLLQPGDSSPAIESDIIYYAIWDYDGSARLYYNNTDKYKIALIWIYYPTNASDSKPWKLVIPYMKTNTDWKITAG